MAKKRSGSGRRRPPQRAQQSPQQESSKQPQPAAAAAAAKSKKQIRQEERLAAARRRKTRNWTVGALTAVAVGVLVALAVAAGGGGSDLDSTDPAAWNLPAMGSTAEVRERVALAEFSGQPTVVNFFASWCVECDRELPGFAAVSAELDGQVSFVGIASAETGNALFMPEKHGVDWWPLARDVGGRGGNDLAVALGARPGAMPLTAFYDSDGQPLGVWLGALLEPNLRSCLQELYALDAGGTEGGCVNLSPV